MDATLKTTAASFIARGVYFGMTMDEYRDDPALGSSNLRDLANNPPTYWWHSRINPLRPPDKETPATIRGTAVHVLVLYGSQAFDATYMRYGEDYEAASTAERTAITKVANKAAAAIGKVPLRADIYDNVLICSAMLSKNPKLATALVGGLNEVSVFWVDKETGIRLKARIDCLKPRGVGDLKSLANKYDKPFPRACIDSVVNYSYHVQAKHYLTARAMIPKLVTDGAVYGARDDDLLKAVCAAKEWAWQFVWWQAEGAPVTYSRIISPANPILELAEATIQVAKRNCLDFMKRFGPNEIWLLEEDATELFLEDMPPWFGR